jgi:L-seryl-tRNA(Ser) seleniumtransferase
MNESRTGLWRRAAGAWSRREFFGAGAIAAIGAALGLRSSGAAAVQMAETATYENNIYTRMFGVRPVIGAFETLSRYGNSRLSPEVLQAMAEATGFFVDLEELNRAAGERIARIMRAEAAMVTSCSAASMALAGAACLTGTDRAKVEALPHPTWPKHECLMQKAHRFSYDRAYRAAGATIVDVETRDELVSAIGERTAFIAGMGMVERDPQPGVLTIQELVEIGKRAGVPVVIDAAGELPPASRLTKYTDMGADLVVVSGGKAIQGPSSSGILAGRRDLIDAAMMNAAPNQSFGRGMKVGREEIVGLMVAIEQYLKIDERTLLDRWTRSAQYIVNELQGVRGLTATLRMTSKGFGDVLLTWDKAIIPLTEQQAAQKLRDGEPRIAYMPGRIIYAYSGPTIVTSSLRPGEEVVVARRLKEFFLESGKSAV